METIIRIRRQRRHCLGFLSEALYKFLQRI